MLVSPGRPQPLLRRRRVPGLGFKNKVLGTDSTQLLHFLPSWPGEPLAFRSLESTVQCVTLVHTRFNSVATPRKDSRQVNAGRANCGAASS